MYTVSRGCVDAPEDNVDYVGCHNELPEEISSDVFDALPSTSLLFDGEVCYSSPSSSGAVDLRRDVMTVCLALMLGGMYHLML